MKLSLESHYKEYWIDKSKHEIYYFLKLDSHILIGVKENILPHFKL